MRELRGLNLSGLSALGGRKNISRKDGKDAKETRALCALREHGTSNFEHGTILIHHLRNYGNSYEIDD